MNHFNYLYISDMRSIYIDLISLLETDRVACPSNFRNTNVSILKL